MVQASLIGLAIGAASQVIRTSNESSRACRGKGSGAADVPMGSAPITYQQAPVLPGGEPSRSLVTCDPTATQPRAALNRKSTEHPPQRPARPWSEFKMVTTAALIGALFGRLRGRQAGLQSRISDCDEVNASAKPGAGCINRPSHWVAGSMNGALPINSRGLNFLGRLRLPCPGPVPELCAQELGTSFPNSHARDVYRRSRLAASPCHDRTKEINL